MSNPFAWTPHLVALDIDGTIEDPSTRTVSPAVRAAIRRTVEAGAHVVIATGRSLLGTLPALDDIGLRSDTDGPSQPLALASNGAVRLNAATGEPLRTVTFDPAGVHARLAELLPGASYAAERLGVGHAVSAPFNPEQLTGPQFPTDRAELLAHPVPRLIACWDGHEPDELIERMRGVELPGARFTVDHQLPWLTIVDSAVSKGAALEELRAELGVAPGDTLAVGDGDNDIQMLRWAAHGVAMGQAPSTVCAAADEITDPVDADGLASVLKRWF